MPREHRDGHRVVAGVLALTSTDVRVGVDPDDGQVVSIPIGERSEGGDAHRALTAQRRNPCRIVLTDDFDGADELLDDDCLGFHAVTLRQAIVGHADRYCHGRTVVRRQDRLEHRRANRVPPTA